MFQKRIAGDELYLLLLMNSHCWMVLKSSAAPMSPPWRGSPASFPYSTGILLPSFSTRGAGGVAISMDPVFAAPLRDSWTQLYFVGAEVSQRLHSVSQDFACSQRKREHTRDTAEDQMASRAGSIQ